MNGLITVAGGVIAVYIIFALIVGQVVEYINNIFKTRGRLLKTSIVELLAENVKPGTQNRTPTPAGKTLADLLYTHPLVGNLGLNNLPSYIAPRTFTLSLVGALRKYTNDRGLVTSPPSALPSAPNTMQLISSPPSSPPALAASASSMLAEPEVLLTDLVARVEMLSADDPLRESLTVLIEQTENRYEAVLTAIDAWYQTQMDRVGGVYKRWSLVIQALIGLIIVVVADADTLGIIDQLVKSQALASGLQSSASAATASTQIASLLDDLSKNGLHYGWGHPLSQVTWKEVGGLAITWGAVLLGAPFWFDVLKKFVPVRMTGTRPAADADDASGDAQSKVQPAAQASSPATNA
jgi:hypothetical protein